MTASLSRSPAREDAPHCPPLMARPLPLRAWPATPATSNDNRAAEVDWNALCAPAPPPVIVAPAPRRQWRVPLRDAAYGLAGALSIVIAVLCLMAH
jgi:hypothetical protein